MNVRCGACRAQFEVAGPGRYACPACGSVNSVREQATSEPSTVGGYQAAPGVSPAAPPPSPPPPPPPLPKIACPECEFEFYVGEIAVAACPNCEAEVETGVVAPEDDEEE
jgi:hypothetical protein